MKMTIHAKRLSKRHLVSICVYTIQIKVNCRIKTKIFYCARFSTPLGLWHNKSAWGHCTRPKRPTIKIINNSTSVIRNGKLSTFHFTRESRVTAIEGTGFESRHPFPFTCSAREGGTEKRAKGRLSVPIKRGSGTEHCINSVPWKDSGLPILPGLRWVPC